MSRPLTPAYCLDRSTSRAYVRINGQKRYLGPYGSKESRATYAKLVAQALAAAPPINPRQIRGRITVTGVIAEWLKHARTWYGVAELDGSRPAGELGNFWTPLSELRRMYGDLPAAEFGPLEFKALRTELGRDREIVDPVTHEKEFRRGMTRKNLNRTMARVRHVFRWAVENLLVPGEVLHSISAVRALPPGRGGVRETEPVAPADEADVRNVLPHLPSRQLRAMVELQLIRGMRPGEVCAMRWCDIDFHYRDAEGKNDLWAYRPPKHKTAHHGMARVIPLGPRSREILREFMRPDLSPTAYIFAPAEAERERNQLRRDQNPKPRTDQQLRRAAESTAGQRQRPPGEQYDVRAYRRAIDRAIEKAFGMPMEFQPRKEDTPEERKRRASLRSAWHRENKFRPNQLRHTRATESRRRHGLEAAQQELGHANIRTTQIYAEPDLGLAERAARETG